MAAWFRMAEDATRLCASVNTILAARVRRSRLAT